MPLRAVVEEEEPYTWGQETTDPSNPPLQPSTGASEHVTDFTVTRAAHGPVWLPAVWTPCDSLAQSPAVEKRIWLASLGHRPTFASSWGPGTFGALPRGKGRRQERPMKESASKAATRSHSDQMTFPEHDRGPEVPPVFPSEESAGTLRPEPLPGVPTNILNSEGQRGKSIWFDLRLLKLISPSTASP